MELLLPNISQCEWKTEVLSLCHTSRGEGFCPPFLALTVPENSGCGRLTKRGVETFLLAMATPSPRGPVITASELQTRPPHPGFTCCWADMFPNLPYHGRSRKKS